MITPSDKFIETFKGINGALSVTESIAIMNISAQVPQGDSESFPYYLELGTHKGKSALSASQTLKPGLFYLLDPIFSEWSEEEKTAFCNLILYFDNRADGQRVTPALFPDYSTEFIPKLTVKYSYVFVDSGSHQDGLPMAEVKLLEDRLVSGGIIAFHDFNSQFKEVREAYDYLLSTGKYEEIKINWDEIIEYVNANNLEEGNLSWHHSELRNPCFVGAVRRK